MKMRVFMSVVVATVCVAFTSSCDKEQSQKEYKFDIELLGKESKMMADINGRSFTREFIFSRPKLSFDNNGQVFLFAGELLKNDYEYINFTIKLSQKIAQSWLEKNTFLTARRIIVKSRFYLKRLLIQAGI